MANQYTQGISQAFDYVNSGVIIPEIYAVAINAFVNRTPLWTRLPKADLGSLSFQLVNDNYRPRYGQVANGGNVLVGATSFVVADASQFDLGDVIEFQSGNGPPPTYEAMLITGKDTATNTLTVIRGYAGTTAAAIPDNTSLFLITNTRTGGEVDINAINRLPQLVEQYAQTVQHGYEVAGSLQSATNFISAYGTPIQRDKYLCAQHCADDIESAMYYGRGVKLANLGRPGMKGLRTLIQTNNTPAPTDAGAYRPDSLIRDTIQKAYDGGGMPSLMVVSTNFLTGLSIWGEHALRLEMGANVFGTRIEAFAVSFLPNVKIIPAPLLNRKDGTATVICLSEDEVRVRMKRPLFDKPRGSRGDAWEGDMIMEAAIELDNEAHHAWVSGITTFAAAA